MATSWSTGGRALGARWFACLLVAAGCGSPSGNNPQGTGGTSGTAGTGTGGGAGVLGGFGGTGGSVGGASAGRGGSVAGAGGGRGGSGGTGGSAPPRPCAHEIDNPSCWSYYETSRFVDIAQAFNGAVFDGRYITVINSTSAPPSAQVRYDTQGDFVSTGWSSFYPNTSAIGVGWRGGTFDGRYVYLTPRLLTSSSTGNFAARYDTQASFASSASWTGFNITTASGTVDQSIPAYSGATFDGRYVYFAPTSHPMGTGSTSTFVASGKVARYDTQATFNAAASWSYFDLVGVDPAAAHFNGVVFDGRYLYFVPIAMTNARVARYDTQASFTAAASWTTFETTSLNAHAGGFRGGVFDGRYVYLIPTSAEGTSIYRCIFTRLDTQGSFADAASWSVVDAATLSNGTSFAMRFSGGAFDGRYVYMIPDFSEPLMRFDPEAPFGAPSSWTSVDIFDVTGEIGESRARRSTGATCT